MAEFQSQAFSAPDSDSLTGVVAGRFSIRERLGVGGMGEVYLAEDTKLKRAVALKRIAPHLRADEAYRKRFLKEAEQASGLTGAHVAAIYDVLEEHGEIFLVMEYIEGQNLRQRLQHPISLQEFLNIAIQCVEALVGAHERNIIHCDLKPENIMLTGTNEIKVLDFGVAKRLPRSDKSSTMEKARGFGGTLAYMAPEVLLEHAVDGRADIFSLGVVFYEMLTGQHPFLSESFVATSDRILREDPVPIDVFNSRVPKPLQSLVGRMLAKDPAERYTSARELLPDLRTLQQLTTAGLAVQLPAYMLPRRPWYQRLSGIAVIVVILAVAAALLINADEHRGWFGKGGRHPLTSIAVLPLANLSNDPAQEYFADGMTEELISDLAKVQPLRVISRTSVMQYRNANKSLPQIAKELQVDAVVEGSVIRSGNKVRITAQLIEAPTDRHLWAETYDRDMKDVLSLQREVADAIVRQVQVHLTPEQKAQLVPNRQVNAAAYEDFLKGRYYWNKRTAESMRMALEYFQQAINKDPTYAPAYAGLADTYDLLGSYGVLSNDEAMQKAKEAAETALRLDNKLAEGYTSLAGVKFFYLAWDDVEQDFQHAIALNPGYANAHHWYGLYLAAAGRNDESVAQMKLAQSLDPLSLIINANLGFCLYLGGHYDQAADELKRTLELDRNFVAAHEYLGQTYVEKAQYADAIAELQTALRLSNDPAVTAELANAYAASGNREQALKLLNDLLHAPPQVHVRAYDLAMVYTGLGDSEQAFRFLRKAAEQREAAMNNINVHPRFAALRGEPRFAALQREMGLLKK